MKRESCFVIMAIGEQSYNNLKITEKDLRAKYDDLIKEALRKARPNLEISRADEFPIPGTITTDIITRIMHSDYVVADVTYPNANVFYELGLRHACRPGTIIIKEKSGPQVPFDISHLRYIEYENTSTGLKELSERLAQCFNIFDKYTDRPDNHFLETAKLIKYNYPSYNKEEENEPETEVFMEIMKSPEILETLIKQQSGEEINEMELLRLFSSNPKIAAPFINGMVKAGEISFGNQKTNRSTRRSLNK